MPPSIGRGCKSQSQVLPASVASFALTSVVITRSETTTQGRILSVAARLFADKGFSGVGIREIANEVGISTASLYHYMDTKEDLLFQLMRDRLDRTITAVDNSLRGLESAECQVVALMRVHVVTHSHYADAVIDEELRSLSKKRRAEIVVLRDVIETRWSKALQLGLRSKPVFQVERPKFARLALIEMANGVKHWYSPEGPVGVEALSDQFADMALALLRASRNGIPIRLKDLDLPPASHFVSIVATAFGDN
jgi:AcrR family transcriptional regulator